MNGFLIPFLRRALFALVFTVGAAVAADDHGHDHGGAPAAGGTASPRIEAHSDLFELVGIVDQGRMTVYLDRYASNEPVAGAKIEFESGAHKGVAAPQADGTYLIQFDALAKPGDLPFAFTVTAGSDTDLLAGDLHMEDAHDHAAPAGRPWLKWLGYAAAAAAALALAAALLRKPKSAPAVLSLVLMLATLPAFAGPGHDHGDSAPAATSNAPKRNPDGSVFLPKTSQRQLAVRTMLAEAKAVPQTVELTGRVQMDANAGGRVQPTQAGRIETAGLGLPSLGQSVRKNQVLAIVRSSAGAIERANQQAQSAELQSQLDLARRRAERLSQLEGSVPQKDIDAAQADVTSLQQRLSAVRGSVSATEQLVAPISGVISSANVVAGQVVDAREVLFEIVNPHQLVVEALAFDVSLASSVASASAVPGTGIGVPLRFVGAGRTQREGAIPLLFRATGTAEVPLAVNQPVKVLVQTRTTVQGVPVPAGSVVKNPSNQDTVWVHSAAETFQPRTVRIVALDGATVAAVEGLKAGDRVVTQGASLLNQVR